LGSASGSFDLAMSRHLLWTLAHPEAAIDEWMRVLRPGGRLVIVDSDPLLDLVAAQEQRMVEEGRERRTRRRYVVWGDIAR
jgi:ubiquinone/menaquinone biosynthesis C-methylase UbiE